MIDNKYKELRDLSSGSYGKVCKCSAVKANNISVAVKVYGKSQNESDGEVRHFLSEWEALSVLNHSNIVQLIEYNESGTRIDDDGNKTNVRYAVLELAANGNLLDYVIDKSMDDNIVRYYFAQLLRAVEYMHNSGLWHRDLKLENILLDNNYNIKVSDFGFATSLEGSNSDNKLYEWKGTLRYMAPEIFKGTGYLGRSVDIFALGVILFSMKTGRPPFMWMAALQDSLYFLIQSNQFDGYWLKWDAFAKQSDFDISLDFKNLFIAMVFYYPNSRLSINEIFKNEWMKGPVASEMEVKMYMKALQKEMELTNQQHYARQENANSNYIVNITNVEEFQVKEKQSEIDDVTAINEKDKGKIMHTDIEKELNLEDDNEFDLGDDDDRFSNKDDEPESFLGYQEREDQSKPIYENKSQASNENNQTWNYEEINTQMYTIFPEKIWVYLTEYAHINNFEANFDTTDFTLNFNIPVADGFYYFGMKFLFVGWENTNKTKSKNAKISNRNCYQIYFLKDCNLEDEEFKNLGLHFLDQISNYIYK